MILIGSHAIRYWFPDFPRIPKDKDYIVNIKPEQRESKTEYLLNPILEKEYPNGGIINKDDLYTLKISHLFWDINWEKHIWDVQWLKEKGCIFKKELFNKLYSFWNEYHGKNKRSDLKMTADKFFNNAVQCEYNHDWLHTLINPYPIFNKILVNGAEVEVDESKFRALTFEDKCKLVEEEVMVMAWERFSKLDFRIAYVKMLKKFIISHAPIWEAIFIIENHKKLIKPSFNYFEKIESQLDKKI